MAEDEKYKAVLAHPVRPSSLPKLEQCRAYKPAQGTSDAAERGTLIDKVIREAWTLEQDGKDTSFLFERLGTEDAEAVKWALGKIHELAGEDYFCTEESDLRADAELAGLVPGTMDGLCPHRGLLVDYKTGQVRDYRLQMGAYALACMHEYFLDTWTAYLLFVDAKQVVTHVFNLDEIKAELEALLASEAVPTPCDYCKWCAGFEACPAVLKAVADTMDAADELPEPPKKSKGGAADLPASIDAMAQDDTLAHKFLSALKLASDWADRLKERIRERVRTSGNTPHFKLISVAGRKICYPLELGKVFSDAGWQNVLEIMPSVPAEKADELHRRFFGRPLSDEYIHTSPGTSQLRLMKPSNKTNK